MSLPFQQQPFNSKTLPTGETLFKRLVGIAFPVVQGANNLIWAQSLFPWAKLMSIEIINGEIGDNSDFFVLDTAAGTVTGDPNHVLNQFGFTVNIAEKYYQHESKFDADILQNLQFKLIYNSMSAKTVYVNFNLIEVK